MKIRIGSLVLEDVTPDELDHLVTRYGGTVQEAATSESRRTPAAHTGNGSTAADRVVLTRLIQAGNDGVPTAEIGDILGRRGRAIPNALRDWSIRVGLVSDQNIEALESARPEGRRGVRLRSGFVAVARELSEN